MKIGRAMGRDDVTIEVWKILDIIAAWLAKLLNKIMDTRKTLMKGGLVF